MDDGMTATMARWTHAAIAGIACQDAALPLIGEADVGAITPDLDIWDMWHLQHADGGTVVRAGRSLWFFLAAPRRDDPNARHDEARIRILSHGADGWRDHGVAFPDGSTPGSREWSGSAVLGADSSDVTMYFTAAGRRAVPTTFEQRLVEARGRLIWEEDDVRIVDWTFPIESVRADGTFYKIADQAAPVNGAITAFRDPGYFRDPADGAEYLLFAGSAGWSDDPFDGVIGIARRDGDGWTLLPPILEAIGVNSELERPHAIVRDGRYYLLWTTQAVRFSPAARGAPTGLYGMVADTFAGPWRPINGTGLIAANPPAAPMQAYCWWVTGECDVISFVDLWGLGHEQAATADRTLRRAHFGGTVAPWFRLVIDGDRVTATPSSRITAPVQR